MLAGRCDVCFHSRDINLGQRYGSVFISLLWSDGCQQMILSDGCGVLPVWGRPAGAGVLAAWPGGHVWRGLVGRVLAALSHHPESANSLSTDCWRWTVEVSWLPIGQSVSYSWQQPADWVERGRTFGRGPPFCHCSGPWGISMMMEWCTLEQPQFLHHYPRGSQHGKGQPRQPATGDS